MFVFIFLFELLFINFPNTSRFLLALLKNMFIIMDEFEFDEFD